MWPWKRKLKERKWKVGDTFYLEQKDNIRLLERFNEVKNNQGLATIHSICDDGDWWVVNTDTGQPRLWHSHHIECVRYKAMVENTMTITLGKSLIGNLTIEQAKDIVSDAIESTGIISKSKIKWS